MRLVPRCRQPATHFRPTKSSAYMPARPRWHHRRRRWCHKKRCADKDLPPNVWRSFYLADQPQHYPHAPPPTLTFSCSPRPLLPACKNHAQKHTAAAPIADKFRVDRGAKFTSPSIDSDAFNARIGCRRCVDSASINAQFSVAESSERAAIERVRLLLACASKRAQKSYVL